MKLVLVEWIDPCTYATHGWLPKEEQDGEKMMPFKCITVGILYKENKKRIIVVLNMNEPNFCQAQSIPRGCITRMRKLNVKED